jgi:hypothetical protein
MIKPFPKIFTIGQDYIKDIFQEDVEITEKIDGSQFSFAKINGELFMRSKGTMIYPENVQDLFKPAVDYVLSIQDKIPDNLVFYCETLKNPKHNVLKYERIPKNHLVLFGISDVSQSKFVSNYEELCFYADILGVDVVPILYYGKVYDENQLKSFLEQESFLGGVKIEGIVVKNYFKQFLLGGYPMPVMMGKLVSEEFKETLREKWGKEFTSKGRFEVFKESFRTEARWLKAIQHLKEKGELEFAPKDIGKLIAEIMRDIEEEEKETIKEFLWKEFGKEILRYATKGFPEFYKNYLLKRAFEKEN